MVKTAQQSEGEKSKAFAYIRHARRKYIIAARRDADYVMCREIPSRNFAAT